MKNGIAGIAILAFSVLIVGNMFSQDISSDVSGKISALENRVQELENLMNNPEFTSLTIKNNDNSSSIRFVAYGNCPRIIFYDKDGNESVEVGISDWFKNGLITMYSNDKKNNTYFWNGAFIPNKTQWAILKINSENNVESYLSDKLIKKSFVVSYYFDTNDNINKISVVVDTITQPIWNYYIGTGKFSVSDREIRLAYIEAGNYIQKEIIIPQLNILFDKYDLNIIFTMKGYSIGTWTNGDMKLSGE